MKRKSRPSLFKLILVGFAIPSSHVTFGLLPLAPRRADVHSCSVLHADSRANVNNPQVPSLDIKSAKIQHRDFFDRASWQVGFRTAERETSYEIDGDFPVDLSGTFFQNGHAKFDVGKERITHPFDADGMITAVTFDNGKAWFRNRFVRTPGYIKETKMNRICYRGIFGTAKNNGAWYSNIFDINFKNVANTHVLYRGGRLFALWEAGMPFEIDPVTLETIGESDMEGTLKAKSRFGAHYKIDPRTGSVCGFSNQPGRRDPLKTHVLEVMEHDKSGNLIYKEKHSFDCVGLLHDMAITENYFVFLHSDVSLDPLPFVLGQKGVAQCIEFNNESPVARLVLVPRGKGKPVSIDVPNGFTFHYCNAFEDATGNVVVDVCLSDSMYMTETSGTYPDKPLWETVPFDNLVPFDLRRITVSPKTKDVIAIESMTAEQCKSVDFPVIHPNFVSRPYRFAYCVGTPSENKVTPGQALVKVDVAKGCVIEKWLPEPHQFIGELSFAARSDVEDDGYLIGYLMDGKVKISSVVIFDAKSVSTGPIAKVDLQDLLPFALHGTYVPGFVPPFPER